jgi:hypothetical protein
MRSNGDGLRRMQIAPRRRPSLDFDRDQRVAVAPLNVFHLLCRFSRLPKRDRRLIFRQQQKRCHHGAYSNRSRQCHPLNRLTALACFDPAGCATVRTCSVAGSAVPRPPSGMVGAAAHPQRLDHGRESPATPRAGTAFRSRTARYRHHALRHRVCLAPCPRTLTASASGPCRKLDLGSR